MTTLSLNWTAPAARNCRAAALALLAALLGACGGGSGAPVSANTAPETLACDPDDASTAAECGVLYLAVTDADGDFLSYTVDVVSISLERADGTRVETLPNSARVDFADYVELTEFVSARNVPPGSYVAGRITVDYSEAEVLVERDGLAETAIVVDETGTSLDTVTLDVRLVDDEPLLLARGVASLLTVDFDLAASHTVDLDVTPIVAVAEPVIVADIEPIDEKTVRVRGPLIEVSEDDSTYTIALRPFHRRVGDNGRVTIATDAATEFDVDGQMLTGADGLAAMAALAAGTPTRALGVLDVDARTFTADEVLAGDSVPGFDRDAARGHVIARDGDTLTLLGATLMPRDDRARFNDRITVLVGADTRVTKAGQADIAIDAAAISVGQKLLAVGEFVTDDGNGPVLDATGGGVRLYQTRLGGTVNQTLPGQVDLTLATIGGRRPALFDFSGTGTSAETDADPDNYEIATGVLALDGLGIGSPARVFGFPSDFGLAPPDFEGRTVIDYDSLPALLGIGWTATGSTAPFLSIGSDALVPDPAAYADDARQTIKIGSRTIELADIDGGISIAGSDAERTLYGIRDGDAVALYRDFADFAEAVAAALDGATAARSLSARGRYTAETGVFEAKTLWLVLVP